MKFGKKLLNCVLMIVVTSLTSCGRAGENVSDKSEALKAYPGARDVRTHNVNETIQLEYWVDEAYPAPRAISWISQNLRENGWEELPDSYFNPQVKGSDSREWVKIIDSRDPGESVVYQKSLDWKDTQNNIVVYGFEYRYPSRSQPDLHRMLVRAIFFPAAIAKMQMEAGQKALRSLDNKKE